MSGRSLSGLETRAAPRIITWASSCFAAIAARLKRPLGQSLQTRRLFTKTTPFQSFRLIAGSTGMELPPCRQHAGCRHPTRCNRRRRRAHLPRRGHLYCQQRSPYFALREINRVYYVPFEKLSEQFIRIHREEERSRHHPSHVSSNQSVPLI